MVLKVVHVLGHSTLAATLAVAIIITISLQMQETETERG